MIINKIPASNQELRKQLYDGALLIGDANSASMSLVNIVRDALIEMFGEDYRHAQFRIDAQEFFTRIGRLRKQIYTSAEVSKAIWAVISALGFNKKAYAFDPPRLRVVMDGGHKNVRAKAVYNCHRDTWYAHSQSHFVWWIPLDDLSEDETVLFYPECYRVPVPNDSKFFDYKEWSAGGWARRLGWQNRNTGLVEIYPALQEPHGELGKELRFSCKRGQNILFAGAHLHRTIPQSLGTTRFSIDFRLLHLEDHKQGIGAPNVDNQSTGVEEREYLVFQ